MENKLKIVLFASPLHDHLSIMKTREALFNELRSVYDKVELIDYKQIDDLKSDESFVLTFIATGGVEEVFLNNLSKLPLPLVILSDSFHNSLAASLEISSWLSNNSISHKHINFPIMPAKRFLEGLESELETLQKLQIAQARLSKTKIGLIGGESPWLISSKVDLKAINKKFGVDFLNIPISELVTYFNNEIKDNIDGELFDILNKKLAQERCREDLVDALRLHNAIEKIVIKYKLNALTIKCFDLLPTCKTTSCLSLSLLNDKGIVAGCEGDIPALWSMLIANVLCDSVSFMANPSSIERGDRTIDFAHCTVPVSMSKTYNLPSHFESKTGIGVSAQIVLGKYTLFKCGGLNLNKHYVFEGEIIQNTCLTQRCRTQVKFQFKTEQDVDEFLNSHLGNHAILISGKHKNDLKEFFKIHD